MSHTSFIGKQCTGIHMCRRYMLLLILIMSVAATNWAQYISIDNHTGSWNDDESWMGNESPGTSINDEDIECYGWLTAENCLDYNNGQFRIHDTLVVYGTFALLNKSQLFIEPGGILIVFGDYYSNNKVEVENSGHLIVTGEFKMQGSDNQGFFHNSGGKVFLFDNEPEIKGGPNYNDLACDDTSGFPLNCGYGNEWDLAADPVNDFFSGFGYDPENDTIPASCMMVSFEADRVEVCQSDTVTFVNLSIGVPVSAEYTWDFGDGAFPRTLTGTGPHKIVYDNSGLKDVGLTVTDEEGVSLVNRQEAYIRVEEIPDLDMRDTSRCGTGEILFRASSANGDIIQFSTDEGETILYEDNSDPYEFSVYVEEWHRKIVWGRAIDTATGCMTKWDQTANLYAYPVPDASIVGDSILCNGNELYLTTGQDEFIERYLWHDGSTLDFYRTNREEVVSVTVWNNLGCEDTDTLIIESCEQKDLFSTTIYAFSPNADGVNDYWILENIEDYPEAKIWIYNAAGKLVFYSPGGYQNDWDGTCNGQVLPMDSYYFLIDFSRYNKNAVTGLVTLIYLY